MGAALAVLLVSGCAGRRAPEIPWNTRAQVSGVVYDARSFTVLRGVWVELVSPAIQGPLEVKTDDDGVYSFVQLHAAHYTAVVTLGEIESRYEFRLDPGSSRRIDVRVELDHEGSRTVWIPGPGDPPTKQVWITSTVRVPSTR